MGHAITGDGPPLCVQGPHAGVSEEDTDVVPLLFRHLREIGEEGGGQRIPRQNVHTAADHDTRGRGELVEQAAQLRLHLLYGLATGAFRLPAGQLEEVIALVVAEMEDLGQSGQHRRGRLDTALLQARVVVGADGGKQGDLLTAESCNTPRATGVGQSDGTRAQLGPARLEEISQLVQMRVAGHGS